MSTTDTAGNGRDRPAVEAPWWHRPTVRGPYWMLAGTVALLSGGPRWVDWLGAAVSVVGVCLLVTSLYRGGRR